MAGPNGLEVRILSFELVVNEEKNGFKKTKIRLSLLVKGMPSKIDGSQEIIENGKKIETEEEKVIEIEGEAEKAFAFGEAVFNGLKRCFPRLPRRSFQMPIDRYELFRKSLASMIKKYLSQYCG